MSDDDHQLTCVTLPVTIERVVFSDEEGVFVVVAEVQLPMGMTVHRALVPVNLEMDSYEGCGVEGTFLAGRWLDEVPEEERVAAFLGMGYNAPVMITDFRDRKNDIVSYMNGEVD